MAIEFVPVALVPNKLASPVPAPQGNSKPTADSKAADKDSQEFRKLLDGLETPEDAPADSAAPPKDADPAGGAVGRKKLLATDKTLVHSGSTDNADTAAWMAAHLPPVPVPLAPASVSGTSDAMGVRRGAGSQAASKAAVGSAAPPSGVPDARTQSDRWANYASVFEQIQSRLAAGGSGAQDPAGQGIKGLAKPVLGTAAADTRADQMAAIAHSGVWTMPAIGATAVQAANDAIEAMQWAVREAGDKREDRVADKAPEGGVGHSHFTPTVHFESTAASVDASQAAPEAAVADQVSYWISQGIQNAELTFDGADAQPVQVSISLSGNEAHVAFRTDQPEARDLLTGAATHLKDLLQSQGMVLSGLSVGSSGAGGANARERRPPPEERKNTARSAPEVGTVRPTAPTGSSGRSVDLFV